MVSSVEKILGNRKLQEGPVSGKNSLPPRNTSPTLPMKQNKNINSMVIRT
jgi:hypothetical protein